MVQEHNIRYPIWWQALLVCAVVGLLVIGLLFFRIQRRQQEAEVAAHLRTVAELKVLQIVAWRQERFADAVVLMEREHLLELIEDLLTGADPLASQKVARRLRTIQKSYQYSDIRLVDTDKHVRLHLSDKDLGLDEGFSGSVDNALLARHPVWTPVHTAKDDGAPHLAVVAPLFSVRNRRTPLGALVLVCDAERFLYPLIQSWPTPSRTAETLLVRKEGASVLFLNDLRHQPGTALSLRFALSRTDLPAVMAVTGRRGFVTGKDYRGERVAAVVLPIPDSPWYIISKIDTTEAFAEWRTRSAMTLMLVLIAMGLVVVAGLVFRQRSLKSHYRDLYFSEAALTRAMQRHSITLQSIGDAVIATDADGRVELMNPVAETLTGWKQGQAIGRPISEVFHIIHEQTREPMENPVTRVLEEDKVVTLVSHTLLIARDGREIPIADSGAPMRNAARDTIGVVLVFKDQTQEHAYQKQILESEEKYRLISDNSVDVIWTLNLDLEFTYINPAVYALSGFTQQEWIGSRLQDHCDEAAFADMATIVVEELARGPKGKGVIFESVMLKKNGDPFPVEIRGKVNFDEEGNPVSLQGVTRDISERKAAEAKLRHQDALLREIGAIAKIGGWEFNPATGQGTWTDEVARMHDLSPDEATSLEKGLSFYRDDSRARIEDAVQQAIENGVPYDLELEMITGKGNHKWVRTIGLPQWQDGKVIKVRGSIQDITDQKRAEEERQASEARFRLLVESAPDGIFVQRQGRFAYLNRSAVRMFGAHSARELLGMSVLDRVHPDQREGVKQQVRLINEEQIPITAREQVCLKMDGTPFDIEASAVPMAYQGADGALVFMRDISDRVHAEKEREKLQQQLYQAQKMESVGRLAGGVAHDYNNILSVIIGYTELSLSLVAPDSPLYDNLQEVFQAAMRSRAITRQLLAFARKEAIVPERLDLNFTVEGMLKMIRRLIGEDIELDWLPSADLWPVKMDPSQIDQILANLCVNARDAIKNVGKITIETANRVLDGESDSGRAGYSPGEYVCLSVSDDGCGMSQEMVTNIFEPFFTTKGVGEGTGLGLSTVYGIARQNNGFIDVYSEPDAGTTFKVFLPRYLGDADGARPQEKKESPRGSGEKILVVEDEPSILKLTTKMLTRLGYSVLTASSPIEALALAKDQPSDIALLITDVIMPEMNGRQLAEQLQPIYPHLKYLFMSGYTADVIAKSGVVEAGVNFIQKPFSAKDLAEKVSEVLYDERV